MMHATGLTETKIDANKCNHAASMHYNIGNGQDAVAAASARRGIQQTEPVKL